MKKKKVLFMVISMNVGGTEKALLNMISTMPKEDFDITIFMLENNGGFLEFVPEWVEVKFLNEYQKVKPFIKNPPINVIRGLMKEKKFFKSLIMVFLFLNAYITKERSLFFKYILRDFYLEEEYDLAVAYAGPMDFISFFVSHKIRAKMKYQWIHFDVTKVGFNPYFAKKTYRNFDKIFVVSEEGKTKLLNILPSLRRKTETFLNVIDKDNIKIMAERGPGFQDDFTGFRILTVGRLSKEKGQDLTIPVLAKLKKRGYHVRWYCIGDGKARDEYKKLIKEHGVEQDYILLGSNSNPYPFMRDCDIYIQPSRHEGYCITLAEAKCFRKPIIATNFTGAHEQLTSEYPGVVVDMNETCIYDGLVKMIDNIVNNAVSSIGTFKK